jgi:hypothetical protein
MGVLSALALYAAPVYAQTVQQLSVGDQSACAVMYSTPGPVQW